MADVLSQTEVESLLAALDHSGASAAAGPESQYENFAQISVYDFKRPERVSKDQMRAFQALHEGFSREFGASASALLRTIVETKLISVDQLTYSEFVFSLENPTCFNLLESKGLEGHLILDLNPSIIFPILDRMLGGGRDIEQDYPNRPLTDIELKLVTRIIELAMRGLENAWANICSLQLRIAQVESNPQLVQIVPPNEVIVLISFEISLGEMRGIMNLCIPFNSIEPLVGKLSSDSWSAYTKKAVDPWQQVSLETGLTHTKVNLVARLAKTSLRMQETMDLSVGDVIVTENPVQQGLQITVEGRPAFIGFPGVYKGHKAIQISQTLERPRDVVAVRLSQQPTVKLAGASEGSPPKKT
ncbi:MAG: flagellar motor switch protein FliM [Planctomycetota bacterium]|nr:flagellar motor switch protein FliM [Planctomycetota bacterium]MDA1212810.1 flagellar motor switch protein FliM [Planctomycetota bacterium]